MSVIATKDEFFDEVSLKTEVVTLDSGKKVIASEITAADYIRLWNECSVETNEADEKGDKKRELNLEQFNAVLLLYGIVDSNGNRIFDECDVPKLKRLGAGSFHKIVSVIKKLNGLLGGEGNGSEPTENGSSSGE